MPQRFACAFLVSCLFTFGCGPAPLRDGAVPPGDDDTDDRDDRRSGAEESCDDGLDDDGDGIPDDGCGCDLGDEQPCFVDDEAPEPGDCIWGVQRCEDHFEFPDWGACDESQQVCGPDDGLHADPGDDTDDDDDGLDGDDGDGPGDDVDGPGDDGDGPGDDGDGPGDDGDGPDVGEGPDGSIINLLVYGEDVVARPVDIVWVVDQSDSMGDEIDLVIDNVNAFSTNVEDAGLDHHVVMVASRTDDQDDHEVCVAPPLAGAGCADSARFRQIDDHVDSHDALEKIEEHIDSIEAFMRDGALRAFIAVTDDESDLSAWEFDAFLRARGGYDDYVFSAFVGLDDDFCDDIDEEGREYETLAAWTGGRAEHLCAPFWDVALGELIRTVLHRTASFTLSQEALAGTVVVEVDHGGGFEILDDRYWDLAPDDLTLVLTEDAPLDDGDVLRITFQPL